jgi:uncharacterized membrane protein
MTTIHIIAGMLALISGAIALAASKGATLHRRAGTAFVVAMLVMALTAAVMAIVIRPDRVNTVAAALTLYLVCSGWLTVKRPLATSRTLLGVLMLLALATGGYAFQLAAIAAADGSGTVDGIPAPPLLMFGTVGIVAGLLDARLLLGGSLRGAQRLARHLWRLGFALFIAAASFFLGQADEFPESLRILPLLAAPVIAVLLAILYFLVRTLWRRGIPAR